MKRKVEVVAGSRSIFRLNLVKRKLLTKIIIIGIIFGFGAMPQPSQASELRFTISIEITITFEYKVQRPSGLPPPLTPERVEIVPRETGSSAVVAKWLPSRLGKPKDGYKVIFSTFRNEEYPNSTGKVWSESYYDVGPDVNELEIIDLLPNTFFGVIVAAKDGDKSYPTNEVSVCTPKFYETDAGCVSTVTATQGKSGPIPNSSLSLALPDKALKSGSIDVNWSASLNASSYVVQWNGGRSGYGEKSIPADATGTTISSLDGSGFYDIRVLALGRDGGYSASKVVTAIASPGAATAPIVQSNTDFYYPLSRDDPKKYFALITSNPQIFCLYEGCERSLVNRLETKGFFVRWRKVGEPSWSKICTTDFNNLGDKTAECFLPMGTVDNVDYEFQSSEVSITPSGGLVAGDFSYSTFVGPHRDILNKNESDREEKENKALHLNAISRDRFNSYLSYLAKVTKVQKAAAEKALAEKALAEKALAEKALAEKALAEKALADKAAADKVAGEKTIQTKVVTVKKTTITCIKGKSTKKVSAVKPSCPAGYKKK